MRWVFALLLAMMLVPGLGAAQDLVVEGRTERTTAEELYDRAFVKLASGDTDGAVRDLEMILLVYPADPIALKANAVLDIFYEEGPEDEQAKPGRRRGNEFPSGLARGELVVTQTLHGIALGIEMCIVIECDSGRSTISTLLVGAGAGLTFSLLVNREEGVYPGMASAMNSGTYWGAWQGLAGSMLLDLDEKETAGIMMGTQLLGLGTGYLIYNNLQPSAGDVSMATSAGLWAGLLTFFVHGATEFAASEKAIWASLLLASDAGLILGSVLTRHYPMSRGRSLIIDASGIAGSLVGLGIPVLIQGDSPSAPFVFTGGIVGMVSGLALATWATHENWDTPEELAGVRFGVQPLNEGLGDGALLTMGGAF